jgi:hypothetical protein
MKTTTSHLPPNLQPFVSFLDAHSLEVQEAFQFLLATAMHEAGKFELLSVSRGRSAGFIPTRAIRSGAGSVLAMEGLR